MEIANLIIIKILMMAPSSDLLGFFILIIREKNGILQPVKNFAHAAYITASPFFFMIK
jgi:hypothetical protein